MTECTGKPVQHKHHSYLTTLEGRKMDQVAWYYECNCCKYKTAYRFKESEAQQLWTEDHG